MFTTPPTPNFNSFDTLEQASDYHNDRGNVEWAALNTASKQANLIKGTDYIKSNYVFAVQPWDEDGVVEPMLVAATAQLALYAITTDLAPVGDDRVLTSESSKLDGLGAISQTFAAGLTADRFPAITNMLANLATYSPATSKSRVIVGRIFR